MIHRRVKVPSSLTDTLFDGAIVKFRNALNNLDTDKSILTTWDANRNCLVLAGEKSLPKICDFWEFAADAFFYGLASIKHQFPDVFPDGIYRINFTFCLPNPNLTNQIDSPIWSLSAFQTREWSDLCIKVKAKEEAGYAADEARRQAITASNNNADAIAINSFNFPHALEQGLLKFFAGKSLVSNTLQDFSLRPTQSESEGRIQSEGVQLLF